MKKNQILAALQIENDEVRLVVGEFYNEVLYIIAKEIVPCKGINGIRIVDENLVIASIKEATNKISEKLKTPILSVLLCIPGYRFKKEKRLFEKLLDDHVVKVSDVKTMLKDAYRANVGSDYTIVNATCSSFKANGITYPKMPIGEKSDMLTTDIDLICGDKFTAIDYVSVVEKAGLSIIDIYQDGYASSAEAALFEQSFNNYVINIHLEGAHMVLSLMYNGRVVAGLSDNIGYDQLVKPIMKQLSLSYKDSTRLLFRYGIIGKDSGEDRIINKWKNANGVQQSVTYDDIQKIIYEPSNELVESLYAFCSNILRQENVSVFITGRGASLQNLQEVLTEKFGRKVKCYCPDTLGVRESRWTSLVGMFYLFADGRELNDDDVDSIDMIEFKSTLINRVEIEEEKNMTSKFKTFTDRIFVEKE